MLTAIRFTFLILLIGGIIYPLAITGIGQLLFPAQANGSLIKTSAGQVVGSSLIGQPFSKPEYFHPRPAVNGYDASNSGGSNLAVTSKKLIDRVGQDSQNYVKENPGGVKIPVDAITASGSNLDPHISLANALTQAPRIATTRQLNLNTVKQLIADKTEHSVLAEAPYVNVLQLNLALDQVGKGGTHGH